MHLAPTYNGAALPPVERPDPNLCCLPHPHRPRFVAAMMSLVRFIRVGVLGWTGSTGCRCCFKGGGSQYTAIEGYGPLPVGEQDPFA
eukprot:454468-Hanusia_phi.AAC.2